MITLRYAKEHQSQELDECIYHVMEDSDFEMYECFEEDYQGDTNEVVAQFEGSYAEFEECKMLLMELKDLCPDIKFSDEEAR